MGAPFFISPPPAAPGCIPLAAAPCSAPSAAPSQWPPAFPSHLPCFPASFCKRLF
nr:MAG TPA: hypothetical protein [Caudoviricetes sp.]